jgi:hypothetical protein
MPCVPKAVLVGTKTSITKLYVAVRLMCVEVSRLQYNALSKAQCTLVPLQITLHAIHCRMQHSTADNVPQRNGSHLRVGGLSSTRSKYSCSFMCTAGGSQALSRVAKPCAAAACSAVHWRVTCGCCE